uniref:Uncharacterized protein MANES_15G153800 n=1 Tax=Rhizophora mucronata TaxID=61149 RepID=A0A2P2IML6_RHIMU
MAPPAAMDSQETAATNSFAVDGVRGVGGDGDLQKSRVTVVGSGNWGSVAAKLIASNALKLPSFHDEVKMWVYEETLPSGEKLTDVINQTNENVKYLPGIKLGKNVIADPDLENAGTQILDSTSLFTCEMPVFNHVSAILMGEFYSERFEHAGVCNPTSVYGGDM